METELVGVILAAGRGTRMAPLSEQYPKPLLPICNVPLLQHQIEIMTGLGIREVIILLGHKGFHVARVLGDGSQLGVRLRYVEQPQMLGIAHAVGQLEPYVDRPFLLFLGDIFFEPGPLTSMQKIFAEQGGGAVLAAKLEDDPMAIRRNYAISRAEDGRVRRVVEKPRYTDNRLKGVGLYLFDLTIFDAIRRTPRTAMRDEYEITEAIQILIDDGPPVRVYDAIEADINMTNPTDLLRCNVDQLRRIPDGRLIGAGVRMHPDARVEASAVGARAAIENPIRLRNCVVFDDTVVTSEHDLDQCIVTPDWVIDCARDLPIVHSR